MPLKAGVIVGPLAKRHAGPSCNAGFEHVCSFEIF